ncbi:hypothetical protein C8R45DRAFT_1216866 [Mycena sanguinolenta]|nr:hypothetical protein C8R45DRAFT_1216866 [Mycena sanguinolenta]
MNRVVGVLETTFDAPSFERFEPHGHAHPAAGVDQREASGGEDNAPLLPSLFPNTPVLAPILSIPMPPLLGTAVWMSLSTAVLLVLRRLFLNDSNIFCERLESLSFAFFR